MQNEHNPLRLRQEKCESVVQKVPFYTKKSIFYNRIIYIKVEQRGDQ